MLHSLNRRRADSGAIFSWQANVERCSPRKFTFKIGFTTFGKSMTLEVGSDLKHAEFYGRSLRSLYPLCTSFHENATGPKLVAIHLLLPQTGASF